ncbi:MAG TPA: hypothetical protein VEB20_04420, partial [Azospirillaceae bacterium]|nr:hypothetical protein [Azospirillaceae bacterium]
MQNTVLHVAGGWSARCTQPVAVSTGLKSVTVTKQRPYVAGEPLRFVHTEDPGNSLSGKVAAYDPATGALSFQAEVVTGAGTWDSWRVLPDVGGALDRALVNLASTLNTTSATPVAVGMGARTFTVAGWRPFALGQWLKATARDGSGRWVWGPVTVLDAAALTVTVEVQRANGAGTPADWQITGTGPDMSPAITTGLPRIAVTADLQLTAAHNACLIDVTGGSPAITTQTPAQLGVDWSVIVRNSGGGAPTVALGAGTRTLGGGGVLIVQSDGTALNIVLDVASPAGGAADQGAATSVTLTAASPRLQRLAPVTSPVLVTLPDARTLPEGTGLFTLVNTGTDEAGVVDHAGTFQIGLMPGQSVEALLLDNATAAGTWLFLGECSAAATVYRTALPADTTVHSSKARFYAAGTNQLLWIYERPSDGYTVARLITRSGRTISFGSVSVIRTRSTFSVNTHYNKCTSGYRVSLFSPNAGNTDWTIQLIEVSGSTINVGTETAIGSGGTVNRYFTNPNTFSSTDYGPDMALADPYRVVFYWDSTNFYTAGVFIGTSGVTVNVSAWTTWTNFGSTYYSHGTSDNFWFCGTSGFVHAAKVSDNTRWAFGVAISGTGSGVTLARETTGTALSDGNTAISPRCGCRVPGTSNRLLICHNISGSNSAWAEVITVSATPSLTTGTAAQIHAAGSWQSAMPPQRTADTVGA